jgi:hypothetical protein
VPAVAAGEPAALRGGGGREDGGRVARATASRTPRIWHRGGGVTG